MKFKKFLRKLRTFWHFLGMQSPAPGEHWIKPAKAWRIAQIFEEFWG